MKRVPIQIRIPIISDKQNCCPYEKPFGYIYKITNKINGHYYIGKHKYGQPALDKTYEGSGLRLNLAYKKYGKANFSTSILEWSDNEYTLNSLEKKWIQVFKACEFENYNIALGGEGGITWKTPEENPAKSKQARKKISEQKLALGENHPMKSLQARRHQSEIMKGRLVGDKNPMKNPKNKAKHLKSCRSEEHRHKLSVAGKKLGENHPSKRQEYRVQMSKIMKELSNTPERKALSRERLGNQSGGNNYSSKRVKIVETGQIFSCLKELSKYLGCSVGVISDRINKNKDKPINSKRGLFTVELVRKDERGVD